MHFAFGPEDRVSVSTLWHADARPAAEVAVAELSEEGFIDQPHPDVVRYNFAQAGGSGSYLQVRIDTDLVVGLANIVLPEPAIQHYWADEPLLMLRASLSAGCAYTVPGLPSMVFNRPEVVIAYVPQGAEILVDVYEQARQHSVILLMNAARFMPRFGLLAAELPPVLQGVFNGTAPTGRLITLPLDERLGQLVETMTQSMRNLALQRLAVAGALSELVARVLDSAERNPAFAGATGLRHRELDLAHAVRDLLDQHATAPPKFADLARQLGTNQKALKVVFRRVFSTTMADYCVQRRMRLAQSLLLEGRLTIGQVADRVGYEHQSSFTAAFRAHAGMAPRDYQRQRAALDVSLAAPTRKNPRPGRSA
jgi:AraC-like DNA-binding protein